MRSFSFLFFAILAANAFSYKFLVISPIFGYSHMKFMGKLADILADAGHQVTFFQPHSVEHLRGKKVVANKNVTIVDYENTEEGKAFSMRRGSDAFAPLWETPTKPSFLAAIFIPADLAGDFKHVCNKMFQDKELHEKWQKENYDVVISEPFDFCGLYLADYVKAKSIISAFSSLRFTSVLDAIGAPSGSNYVPYSTVSYGFSSIIERFENLIGRELLSYTFGRVFTIQWNDITEAIGKPIKDWRDVLADSTFLFTNSNPYLDFPAPSISKVVPIGGFSMDVDQWKKAKLTEEFEKILSEKPTTVLVSFGSVVRSADMPQRFKDGIIKVFNLLSNTTFIWKYEVDDVELRKILPSNVHLSKWVPQTALLADDRVKVFVTHGGLGSSTEVAYSGKPAIFIPLFGDQPINAEMLARHGGAVKYEKQEIADGDKLAKLLEKMISTPSYATNAKRLAEILRDQPVSPKEVLLKHAEFAARFGHIPSLEPNVRHLNFIQYYFLDIFAILIAVFAAVLFFVYKILQKCTKSTAAKQKVQ